ncbi:MAG: hypothetical protein U0935_03425 [Pirellulales bacterium]
MAVLDEPQESLGGCTPLQAAHDQLAMDAITPGGVVGRSNNAGPPASGLGCIANLNAGYDLQPPRGEPPLKRPPVVTLGPDDWAIRRNLVTIETRSRSFTADHISSAEGRIAGALRRRLGTSGGAVCPESYRGNLLLYRARANPLRSPSIRERCPRTT